MVDTTLVPEKTVITAKGDGAAVDVSAAANRVFLATLYITNIIEQESLDVSIYGSVGWGNLVAETDRGISAEVLSMRVSVAGRFNAAC